MRKLGICLLCFVLLGCQGVTSQKKDKMDWEGHYKKGDIEVVIKKENDFPDGVRFDFLYKDDDMGEYASFEDESQGSALCAVTEDGYTLRFTLEKDKVIIEEIDGYSYLDVALSGEYKKEKK